MDPLIHEAVTWTGQQTYKNKVTFWKGAHFAGGSPWFDATDFPTVQKAVDEAINAGGGTVYFPEIIEADTQITVTGNKIRFLGNQLGGLYLANNAAVSAGANWPWILVTGDDFTLDGMVIDGNGTNQTYLCNLVAISGSYVTFKAARAKITNHCLFKNAYGTALWLGKCYDAHVSRCRFQDSTGAAGNPGEGIAATFGSRGIIEHCFIDTMADAGFYLSGTTDYAIHSCIVKDCANAAANLYGDLTRISFVGDHFINSGPSPISDASDSNTNFVVDGCPGVADIHT